MIEPMILPRLIWPADVIAATIVAEAMVQCKTGRRKHARFDPDTRKPKAKASAAIAQKQFIGIAMPQNDGLARMMEPDQHRKRNCRHRGEHGAGSSFDPDQAYSI